MSEERNTNKERRMIIIGAGSMAKTVAMAISENTNNICVLYDVADSAFSDLTKPEPFLVTRPPEFEEPWIDAKGPVINHKKHEHTCAKNRKARKKKKRR